MAKLICEICGGDVLLKEGTHFRCTKCGACYSPEQLKKMLEEPATPAADAPITETPVVEQPAAQAQAEVLPPPEDQHIPPKVKKEKRKMITAIIAVAIALGVFALFFSAVLATSGLFPQKNQAKDMAQGLLEREISNENVTLAKVKFDTVETIRFFTREEDPVGYFADIEMPMKVTGLDGKEYESQLAYFRSKFGEGYDPEADAKWAYIMEGTYEAVHKEHGVVTGEFYITYACNLRDNSWMPIETEYGVSESVLRQDVHNHLTAYLLLSYDIQPNPQIEITAIEKERESYSGCDYTVYGTVTVRDNYGDKYYGKFTAEYSYSRYDQHFEKESVQVDALSRNPLIDILEN